MTFSKNRVAKGNEKGIEVAVESIDPLFRKNFMCSESLDKLLKQKVFDSGMKTSESELIREALTKLYT